MADEAYTEMHYGGICTKKQFSNKNLLINCFSNKFEIWAFETYG